MAKVRNVMTMSRNGQVSIPAEIRARWGSRRLIVVDMGEYAIVRPVDPDAIERLRGILKGPGPSTAELRRQEREAEAEREETHG